MPIYQRDSHKSGNDHYSDNESPNKETFLTSCASLLLLAPELFLLAAFMLLSLAAK